MFILLLIVQSVKVQKDKQRSGQIYIIYESEAGSWLMGAQFLLHTSLHLSPTFVLSFFNLNHFQKKKRAQKHLSLLGRDGHEIEITQGLDDTRPPEMVWNPSFLTKEIDISVFKQTPTPFMSRPLRYKKQL